MNPSTSWRTFAPRYMIRFLVAVLAALAVSTVAIASAMPAASAQQGYTIRVTDGSIDQPNGQTTVVLRLEPGPEPVGAISVDVVSDTAALQFVAVNGLAGVCNVNDTSVAFAGLDASGWTEPVDLCEITVQHTGGASPSPITPLVLIAVTAQNQVPLEGAAIAGLVTVGSLAPEPTPTRPPTTVATATPETGTEPTAEPVEPTPQPTVDEGASVNPEPSSDPVPAPDSPEDPGTADAPDAQDDAESEGETDPPTGESDQDGADQEAAGQSGTDIDPDRGTRPTPEPSETSEDPGDEAVSSSVDEESAAPLPPAPTAEEVVSDDVGAGSPNEAASARSDDQGGPSGGAIAVAAIALLAVGGGLGVAARRANRN